MTGFFIGMIITGALGLLLTVLGLYMVLTGKGSLLIAGYNTMPEDEREKYDNTALSKFIGKAIITPLGILTVLFALGASFGFKYNISLFWVAVIIYSVIVTGLSIFAVIYLNTGNRFKK